jgi:hypothetical protein
MARDLAAFRAFYPEFSTVADDTVNAYLGRNDQELAPETWGDCFDRAVLSLTAHEVALLQARLNSAQTGTSGTTVISSGGGPIQSASGGGLSIGFSVPTRATDSSGWQEELSKTPYGQEFIALTDRCIAPIMIVGRVNNSFIRE